MSKVLLMVEREGRVVCDPISQEAGRYFASCPQDVLDLTFGPYGCCWWLVEAESAAAARHIIGWNVASHGLFDSAQGGGRILASGGKNA